ncbi:MAG: PocR ligand-binding domain-containing protein [Deltaproteobacteria bacterium]|nr:PocR ligand-binding domain-containing protein [Deltaproteobacteria bacterium]MBW2635257.1 PocR ligand-binding domain-containing protein [Deltaproteobacteria bacterium]MBW2676739.1 PocR ligand-binding domain-containing protein [Deltaproteobacteria bacterium]
MKLTDIYPVEKWVELEQEIHDRFHLDSNVFNVDGIRISEFKAWVNMLCPVIKATDKGQSFICAVAHMNLAVMAKNSGKAVVEECDAGLVKIVIPIFLRETFLGAVGACGLLMDDGEVDAFLVNKITDIEEEKVANLSEDIGSISSNKIKELISFVEDKIDHILTKE